MFKELFTEATDARAWNKFAKTIQQASNTAKIPVSEIRVVNNSSIEILGTKENLEDLRDDVLVHFINSRMKTTIHYSGADNKSGSPMP